MIVSCSCCYLITFLASLIVFMDLSKQVFSIEAQFYLIWLDLVHFYPTPEQHIHHVPFFHHILTTSLLQSTHGKVPWKRGRIKWVMDTVRQDNSVDTSAIPSICPGSPPSGAEEFQITGTWARPHLQKIWPAKLRHHVHMVGRVFLKNCWKIVLLSFYKVHHPSCLSAVGKSQV